MLGQEAVEGKTNEPSAVPVLIERLRERWGIENLSHWVLDVVFAEDRSRPRKGRGARNMAIVRRFAVNLIGAAIDKKSIKPRRKNRRLESRD